MNLFKIVVLYLILRASLMKILFDVPVPEYLTTTKSKNANGILDNFVKFMYYR